MSTSTSKAFLLFVLGLTLVSCGGDKSNEKVVHGKIGDSLPMRRLYLTVLKVHRNIKLEDLQDLENSTKEVVGVFLKIENKGKRGLGFHVSNISLHDDKGNTYYGYPQGVGSSLSNSRVVAMGDRIQGTLIYSVPRGSKLKSVQYVPKNMKDTRLIIDLE